MSTSTHPHPQNKQTNKTLKNQNQTKKPSVNNANTAFRPSPFSRTALFSLTPLLPSYSASPGRTHRKGLLPPVTDLGVWRSCPHHAPSFHATGKPGPSPPWQRLGAFLLGLAGVSLLRCLTAACSPTPCGIAVPVQNIALAFIVKVGTETLDHLFWKLVETAISEEVVTGIHEAQEYFHLITQPHTVGIMKFLYLCICSYTCLEMLQLQKAIRKSFNLIKLEISNPGGLSKRWCSDVNVNSTDVFKSESNKQHATSFLCILSGFKVYWNESWVNTAKGHLNIPSKASNGYGKILWALLKYTNEKVCIWQGNSNI